MNIPFDNNIIVKPTQKKQVLVSDNKKLCLYGEVIAVGDLVKDIKVGETIIYEKWGLKSPEIDGEEVHFISRLSPFLLGKIV